MRAMVTCIVGAEVWCSCMTASGCRVPISVSQHLSALSIMQSGMYIYIYI